MPVLTLSPEDEYSYRAAMPMLLADRYDHKLTAKERKDNRKLYRYCLRQYKIEIREQCEGYMSCMEARGEDCGSMFKTMLTIHVCLMNLELVVVAHFFRVRNLVVVVETYMNAIDELMEVLRNQANV